MRVLKLTGAALLGVVSQLGSSSAELDINGWYPCGYSDAESAEQQFECAEVKMPLCHEGVCESDKDINIFVKRLLGYGEPRAKKAVWLLQGGPGGSTAGFGHMMNDMQALTDGEVDFYAVDQRGTGRSHFLKCDAAQAMTPGSPSAQQVDYNEYPSCVSDLLIQMENQTAAFSTTSFVMDLKAMINELNSDQDAYVMGLSYGTFVVERLMQVGCDRVKGYIVEGVDSSQTPHTANTYWNTLLLSPSRRLLEYCFDDSTCPFEFTSRDNVMDDVLDLYKKLDDEVETNTCAQVLAELGGDKPSVLLRSRVASMVSNTFEREEMPWVLALAQRCSEDDVGILKKLFASESAEEASESMEERRFADKMSRSSGVLDELNGDNGMLYGLIVTSERMAEPSPAWTKYQQEYETSPFAMQPGHDQVNWCIFKQMADPVCKDLPLELPKTEYFAYERDQYYGQEVDLQDDASLLVFNGGLDFATMQETGQSVYELVKSNKGKLMVNFDFGNHCAGEGTASSTGATCRDTILMSFVKNDGHVENVDTSCMKELPPLHFMGWD